MTEPVTASPSVGSPAPIAERVAAPAELPTIAAGGLSWRAATRDDTEPLLALKTAISEADHEPYRESLAEVAELFDAPWRDFEHDSLLGHDTDGVLRAYGLVDTFPGDVTTIRAHLDGGVHASHRGRGIGRELLGWQEARARQLLAASGKERPARIQVFVEDDAPGSRLRLYDRAGYVPLRFYSDLGRDLQDLGTHPVPEVRLGGSLRLVPISDAYDEATRLAHNDAFRDHWGSEPRSVEQWRTGRSTVVPDWSFVVVDDTPDVAALLADPRTDPETAAALRAGEPLVVGYEVASRYDEDFPVRGYSFGYTEILGVRGAYRGRKIAVALLAAAMRAFAADGMQYANLDVDTENPSGAHGLYASLGYVKTHGSHLRAIEL